MTQQLVGVAQAPPSNPTLYPFPNPEAVLDSLVQDFYLSYEDNKCQYELPFRIFQLTGFDQAGQKDVIVHDAAGAVVFNSDDAATIRTTNTYGTGIEVVIFVLGRQTCRIVYDPDVKAPAPYVPIESDLEARTLNQLPLRITSIRLNGGEIVNRISFTEGNNVRIQSEEQTSVDGQRVRTKILMRARPGDGEGRADGCDELDDNIKTINQLGPAPGGNFIMDPQGCYRWQRPGVISQENPRQFSLGGTDFTNNTTSQLNEQPQAYVYGNPEDTIDLILNADNLPGSSIQFYNDCAPCCSCTDFVNTYKGLSKQFFEYISLGRRTEVVRDQFRDNVIRWEEQRACRENRPLRLVVGNAYSCRFEVGGLFFNFTTCCLEPVLLRLTVQLYDPEGVELSPDTFLIYRPATRRAGSDTDYLEEEFSFTSVHPMYDVLFDFLDPGAGARIRTLMYVPDCEEGMTIKVTLSAHTPDLYKDEANTILCLPDVTSTVPADVQAIWATDPPAYPCRAWLQGSAQLTPENGFCEPEDEPA